MYNAASSSKTTTNTYTNNIPRNQPINQNQKKQAIFANKTTGVVSTKTQPETARDSCKTSKSHIQIRLIRDPERHFTPPPKSFMEWLQAKEITEMPTMELANRALETILLDFKQHNIKTANLMAPEELVCRSKYNRKLEICCDTLVEDCRQRNESNRRPEYSEQLFLEHCKIPYKTGGVICDIAAMLAYKKLYKLEEITPFLIGFRRPPTNHRPESGHLLVGIFHGTAQPEQGQFILQEGVEKLGENIHIIDPWLGFACRATDYPHFATTTINHLNKQGYRLIDTSTGKVTLRDIPNFVTNSQKLEVTHLPTLWEFNTSVDKSSLFA